MTTAAGQVSEIILRTRGVGKTFGKFVALNNISAEFSRGAITSIIGPNGAGKSTYFNLLCGAFQPTKGSVEFEGRDVTGLPQHRFAHMGIAKSFQITSVFPQLTTRENIRVGLQALVSRYDIWRPRARLTELVERADELLALVGLWESRERAAKTLAHGEQRALEIGMALASQPRLLLLDEPTAGMSPEETRTMMDLIVKLAKERTVILVEHKMKLVLGISDRILVLHHGELLAEGTPQEVRQNEAVKRVYLGQREH
ncbi:ABC transporter ATP-binding protein [Bradyrhizobium sp. NAS96.2]|uniref:ABC transporter ATP-binding protein n=1 Tax=Bradyrhizobium sp. NAS96.2 TaxID=1680160 RepID=UPI00093E0F15|nr:ABC transporter ATP-binding protein [Bradyrhizobium sp. NAS96.2]OKO82754.1 branched-chain amino acid ABC transporter substrate-binding protein [Bradyrhizobium sp. NAS96.2]